ncbi:MULTISPECIES: SdpI family protein [unclassified Parvimonas]|uniref:SdpI family protein n=1 Tax=unclassified Parvimonas TaxID=1151464 RepID=UPI002B462821|nr:MULTISPECIES: SdpI family protein [unclassified Parvimonas]MEB3024555.1 SdpI family protein [Parvimonas sp. M13]MEB3088615.1 SdpI family protein [Parvimonas sp. M20]
MNKFLKLLLILVITPIILATAGFAVLPSAVFAYIKDGKEVFIGSFMIYTFALVNAVLSFFGITYLRRVRKKFNDENYPTGVTVVAFVTLLISIMCNYFTFSVLKLMLKNSKMEIPFYVIRLVFTLIAILTTIYGIYLRKVNKESEFAIRNKWTMSNDIVFGFANKFSGIVFIAGGIFLSIVSWIIGNQSQLYITTLFTLIICAISSNYISRTIGMKYKMMYKEKDKKI